MIILKLYLIHESFMIQFQWNKLSIEYQLFSENTEYKEDFISSKIYANIETIQKNFD